MHPTTDGGIPSLASNVRPCVRPTNIDEQQRLRVLAAVFEFKVEQEEQPTGFIFPVSELLSPSCEEVQHPRVHGLRRHHSCRLQELGS
jgi:hypothetical protein